MPGEGASSFGWMGWGSGLACFVSCLVHFLMDFLDILVNSS